MEYPNLMATHKLRGIVSSGSEILTSELDVGSEREPFLIQPGIFETRLKIQETLCVVFLMCQISRLKEEIVRTSIAISGEMALFKYSCHATR